MKDIVFAKALDCSLNTQINNLEDSKQNMRSLENFQSEIDKLQTLKDSSQIEHNGLALTLIRKHVMEKKFGCELMRNLIRKYYPLNDEQIVKYENIVSVRSNAQRYITNHSVCLRKGEEFSIGEWNYNILCNSKEHPYDQDFLRESREFIDVIDFFHYNYSFDFHDNSKIRQRNRVPSYYRNALLKNEFAEWDFELVNEIYLGVCSVNDLGPKSLLYNKGFIAQQDIDKVEETIKRLQILSNSRKNEESKRKISDDEVSKYVDEYKSRPYELYSYLPLTESFILEHQDELNWQVLDENPQIEWTLQLVSILLDKFELLSDPEQQKGIHGSKIMYEKVFDGLLNDEIISDLEKLYDL